MSVSGSKWHYAENQFQNATRKNFKRMLSLDSDHYGKLMQRSPGDPEIDAIRIGYEPIHTAYVQLYSGWQGAGGSHKSQTLNIKTMFELLNTNLTAWELVVWPVFAKGTVDEVNLFPNRRASFQNGTYEQRITAVKTLGDKLALYVAHPTLVGLSPTVLSFYNLIEGARILQNGGEGAVANFSNMVEQQRLLCAKEMYGTLGKLMYKFRENPLAVEEFWDMTLLRNLEGPDIELVTNIPPGLTEILLPAEVVELFRSDFEITLQNDSADDVTWSASLSDTGTSMGPVVETFPQHDQRKLHIADLGWVPGRNHLVVNNAGLITGLLRLFIRL